MKYESTRGNSLAISSTEAIKKGIAPDGGLYVPSTKVEISLEAINHLASLAYAERAAYILKYFLTDFTDMELAACVEAAYGEGNFDVPEVAPVKKLTNNTAVLELWHGPTCAFKDMALQILPHFLVQAVRKTGESKKIVILVATSGDTGKAALDGFADVPGTSIIVFFPQQGVSEVQRLQMITQTGSNVHVLGVQGNFDDAQSGVKQVFGDEAFNELLNEHGYRLSSANSINWGRLVPQIVYYFSSYADLVKMETIQPGEKINFVVPTGNFGNILAGFYAKQMGLPINRLICASNANNVLTEFINTGTYNRNREFLKTYSPSMDILISSNLERVLYEITGHQTEKINEWMTALKKQGIYSVDPDTIALIKETFWADYANDQQTLETIQKTWQAQHYLVDTHTAVALHVLDEYRRSTKDTTFTVVTSTASPFKFNGSVTKAILGDQALSNKTELDLLEVLSSYTGWDIPAALRYLNQRPILHKNVTDKDQIGTAVRDILVDQK